MIFTPQVYPYSFSSNVQRNTLEYSNQVILPPEILARQSNDTDGILFFTIANKEKKINVGVHEFTDIPDVCYIPYYFMMLLGIKEGERIQITPIEEKPQKATSIILKPQEQVFMELSDPKRILEYHLSRLYPIITVGDVLRIFHDDMVYCLSVSKVEPADIVQTVDCDIVLDFEESHDYININPTSAEINTSNMNSNNEVFSSDSNYIDGDNTDIIPTNYISGTNLPFVAFQGKGNRLGSS